MVPAPSYTATLGAARTSPPPPPPPPQWWRLQGARRGLHSHQALPSDSRADPASGRPRCSCQSGGCRGRGARPGASHRATCHVRLRSTQITIRDLGTFLEPDAVSGNNRNYERTWLGCAVRPGGPLCDFLTTHGRASTREPPCGCGCRRWGRRGGRKLPLGAAPPPPSPTEGLSPGPLLTNRAALGCMTPEPLFLHL